MLDNHYLILITVYNSVPWIRQCIESAITQDYKNFDIVVVDDCSNDGTWEVVGEYDRIIKHRNEVRAGDSLPNTVMALKLYSKSPDDVIVHLDGDDCLAHNNVLNRLEKAYRGNIWITYGQYEPMSHRYHNYCTPIPDMKTYRKSGVWRTSHLKTWRRWLWDKIKDDDLRDRDGNYFTAATDNAFMYPMLEMAGMSHSEFIPDVLYFYNDLNPANYMKKRADELINTSEYIRSKSIYEEL